MRILGIICFVVNLICGNLLQERRPRNSSSSSDSPRPPTLHLALLRKPEYLTLLLWAIFSALGYTSLLFSLSSYSVAVGHTQHQASLASALLNLGQAFGRPAVGFLSDRLGRLSVAFTATFLGGLFCLVIWIFAKPLGVIYFFAIIVGVVAGTLWAAAPPLAAETVGLADLCSALGILWFVLVPPTAVAEAIALQLRDPETDSRPYIRVQLFVGFVYIGAALCLVGLKVLLHRKGDS